LCSGSCKPIPGRGRHTCRRTKISTKTLRQVRSGQALGDEKRIVAERCKEFAQHFGLFGALCHAIDLSLQLPGGKRPLPVVLQRL
jgi:hypothetical protein